MTKYCERTGAASSITHRTPGKCVQQLDGTIYRVDRVGPMHEVRRERWRGGKLREWQPMGWFRSEAEAEELVRRLQGGE